MRYIDLFAGVGGFRYGIEKAFYDKYPEGIQQGAAIENSPDTRESFLASEPLCVFSNEWDKYANSVYKKHWGECDDRDIRTITAEEIPDHDLLVGGFPCQSFSIAGKRGGFEDTRGTLFFEIARIVKQKQPRLLLLENVKGLLSHDKGKTFETIISTLDELGYDCQWQVLNSKNFGVPQNRERVFIVGHLRGTSRPEVFPITGSNSKTLEQIIGGSQGNRVYRDSGVSVTIASQAGGQGAKTGLYAIPVLTPDRAEKRQNGRRFKTDGEPSFTLTAQDKHGVVVNRNDGIKKNTDIANTLNSSDWRGLNRNQDQTSVMQNMQIRRLTPIECERLQGFPDNWTQFGFKIHTNKVGNTWPVEFEISDSQRYKMMGNAVTTNVITEIVKRLI